MRANRLYHITTRSEVETAKSTGAYVPAGFEREGFIHCSHEHQVAAVANRLFRGLDNLVLIEIDPSLVSCSIVEENLEGGKELFPHIYGRLPMSAVVRVHRFACDRDGLFKFPG
jgi:uncharacterized protein (DUF952 family)